MKEKLYVHDQAKEAERALTGKRFCSSCQKHKPLIDGKMVGNKVKRWKCGTCVNKNSAPIYKSSED